MTDPVLANCRTYPRMARWFDPVLLVKLLNNVIVSSRFGQYADRRLIVAALDTQPPEKLFERAQKFRERLKPDSEGAVWTDWVADLGDGFDSTYAIASLLAQKQLSVDGVTLPRGQTLIMGGDEVYPTATAEAYRNQLVQPYAWAFPDHDKNSDEGVPLLAIPGNHDWYDGLVLFLAFFCREKPKHFGSWRTCQRRSYFAVQLTDKWWLWASDVQLQDDIDQPQADYFRAIATQMEPDSKIILCSAEPGWQYTKTNSKAWDNVGYIIGVAEYAKRNLQIPLLLSGDTHHYSRYVAEDGTQFVTSGGGGAFRHPTHHLENKSTVWWKGHGNKTLNLAEWPAPATRSRWFKPSTPRAVYPSRRESRWSLWRDLFFALYNWDFALTVAAVYWLAGVLLMLRDEPDMMIFIALLLGGAIIGYTAYQEKITLKRQQSDNDTTYLEKRRRALVVLATSLVHSLGQVAVVIYAARFFASWNETHIVLTTEWWRVWEWLVLVFLEMGAVGFFIGATLFGINLLITCAFFRMNYNDAFSAFRMNRYNNFLRLRIEGDHVEVFAIELKQVPKRSGWFKNRDAREGAPEQPEYVPSTPLQPHLIEKFSI